MICYKAKYFKYKAKYLELKQKGGNKRKYILPINFDDCIMQNYEEINPDKYDIYLGNKSDIKKNEFLSEKVDNNIFNKFKKDFKIYNCSGKKTKKKTKIITKNTDEDGDENEGNINNENNSEKYDDNNENIMMDNNDDNNNGNVGNVDVVGNVGNLDIVGNVGETKIIIINTDPNIMMDNNDDNNNGNVGNVDVVGNVGETKIIIKNTDPNIKRFEDYINSIDSISGINLFGIIKINGSIIVFLGDNHAVDNSYSHSLNDYYTKLCAAFPDKNILATLDISNLKKKPKHNPPDIFITDLIKYIYSEELSANFYLQIYKDNLSTIGHGKDQTPMRNELLNILRFNKLCKDNLDYKNKFVCNKDKYLYNYTDFRFYYNINTFLKVIQLHILDNKNDYSYIYYKNYFENTLKLGAENFVKFLNKFKNIEFYKIHCFYLFCFGIHPVYITNTNPTNIFTDLKTKYTTYYNSKNDLDINYFFNRYIYDDLNIINVKFTLNKIMFEIPKYSETQRQNWKAKTIIKYDKKNITTTRHAKQLIKVEEKQHVNLQNYLYEYIDTVENFTNPNEIDSIKMLFIDFYSLCRSLYYLGFNNKKIKNSIKYKNSINIVYGREATDCPPFTKALNGICDGSTRGHNSSLIYYFRKYYFKKEDTTKNILTNSNKDYLKKYFIRRPEIMDCVYIRNYFIIIGADTNDFNNDTIITDNIGLNILNPNYVTAINSRKTNVYKIDKIFYSKNIIDISIKNILSKFKLITIPNTIENLIDKNGSDHLPLIVSYRYKDVKFDFVTFNILSLIFMREENKFNIFKNNTQGAKKKNNFKNDYIERIKNKNERTFEKINEFINNHYDSISLQELDIFSKEYINNQSLENYTLYDYLPKKNDGWESHVNYGYDNDNFKKFYPGVGILLNTKKYDLIDRYHIEIQKNTQIIKSVYLILIKAQHKINKDFYILGSIHFCFSIDPLCSIDIQTNLKRYIELIKTDPNNSDLTQFKV